MDPRPAILPTRLRGVRRIIAVTGGKGGIGKSTVATCLALALADAGRSVGLLDLDLWGPSDHVILGVPKPGFREDGGLIPAPAAGVAFMSIASVAGDEAVLLRGEEAGSAILELLAVTIWGELDYLVVDMPPGFADILIDATRHLPRAEHLVVTTPSALTEITTGKTIAVLRRLDRPILGLLVNMADAEAEAEAASPSLGGERVIGHIGIDAGYEAAIGSPERLRATRLYADVTRASAAIDGLRH